MFGSYRDEVLVNGVIREFNLVYHPDDLIRIIHSYYQQQLSFIVISQRRYDYNRFERKQNVLDSTNCISVNGGYIRYIIYPHKFNPWSQPLTLLSSDTKYCQPNQLQYHFEIECLGNMDNDIQIGIIPNNIFSLNSHSYITDCDGCFKPYDTSNVSKTPSYFLKVQATGNKIHFYVERYSNCNKKRIIFGQLMSPDYLSAAIVEKNNLKNDIISVNVDCFHRKVYFLWNAQIIHTVDVELNIPYIPVIWGRHSYRAPNGGYHSNIISKKIKYKVLSMRSDRMRNNDSMWRQTDDLEKFVYAHKQCGAYYLEQTLNRSFYSAKQVIDLLWRGYKLIYQDGIWSYFNIPTRFILEIYQYFYNQYIKYIKYVMSEIPSFTDCFESISLIISHYVIEDYNDCLVLDKQHQITEWIQGKLSKNENFTWYDCTKLYDYHSYADYYCSDHDFFDYIGIDSDFDEYIGIGHENIIKCITHQWLDHDKLSQLAIDFNRSKDEHRKGHLYGDIRYKMKDKRTRNVLSKKRKKRISHFKTRKDRIANYKSNLKFQKRYQLSLQY